jgi:hypothetical protein
LIPFLGVLAPNAKLRARVVPQGPNRGGQLRIIAAIVESVVIERIVTHPGIQRELLDSPRDGPLAKGGGQDFRVTPADIRCLSLSFAAAWLALCGLAGGSGLARCVPPVDDPSLRVSLHGGNK